MLVLAKRNILLPDLTGATVLPLRRGEFTELPAWAAETPYFQALVRDGKISVPEGRRDAALQKAAEMPVRRRKPEKGE